MAKATVPALALALAAAAVGVGCSSTPNACGADCFAGWPEGKDPATVSRRLTDLFLSTSPDSYKPQGYASPQGYAKNGYGGGKTIHYSVVALWINAMECARLTDDKDREQKLIAAFEPYFGEKAWVLPKFKHVDFTIVGSVPLEIAILNGDARAKALGLKYADMQWEKPREDDPPPPYNAESMAMRMEWWNMGYTDQTRLWIDDAYMISLLQIQAYLATGKHVYLDRAARETALFLDRLQLENGLFNHAYRVPFRWARGNGWMAAAMANVLLHLPRRDEFLRAHVMKGYVRMMETLLLNQRDGLLQSDGHRVGSLRQRRVLAGVHDVRSEAAGAYGHGLALIQAYLARQLKQFERLFQADAFYAQFLGQLGKLRLLLVLG